MSTPLSDKLGLMLPDNEMQPIHRRHGDMSLPMRHIASNSSPSSHPHNAPHWLKNFFFS